MLELVFGDLATSVVTEGGEDFAHEVGLHGRDGADDDGEEGGEEEGQAVFAGCEVEEGAPLDFCLWWLGERDGFACAGGFGWWRWMVVDVVC